MTSHPRLFLVDSSDPIHRLWTDLPAAWRGPIIGPGIEGWDSIGCNPIGVIDLTDLSHPYAAEIAWMAHWEAADGRKVHINFFNRFAKILRHAMAKGHSIPASVREMNWSSISKMQIRYVASRGLSVSSRYHRELEIIFKDPRIALIAACSSEPWWRLDDWYPRCDPRIPLAKHDPCGNTGCSPGRIRQPWLREAMKLHLGTMLDSGLLRWTTILNSRMDSYFRLDRWISSTFDDPEEFIGDARESGRQAAEFRQWVSVPENRHNRDDIRPPHSGIRVGLHCINDDVRVVAELLDAALDYREDFTSVLGTRPWDQLTELHVVSWNRQIRRVRRQAPHIDADHYVDDQARSQILRALLLLELPMDQETVITQGDGTTVVVHGLEDPQADKGTFTKL
jgi:hypothetical protein